ncbi:helix-turn-helix transcriptional regulator [Niallia taxi]|uniref:helix-turn-helix transcriptional regulator n=1 Tax=Niallia taxi TaxID=2499688 RepID=UPI003008F639
MATIFSSETNSIQEFLHKCLADLKKRVYFDAACFTTVDTETLLSTGAYTDDRIEKIHPYLFENEYLKQDFNHFEELLTTATNIALLSNTTNGVLEQSERFREILSPAGFADELRAVIIHKGKCYGFLTLLRNIDKTTFTKMDIEVLASLLPPIAFNLYKLLAFPQKLDSDVNWAKSIILLDEDFHITSANNEGFLLADMLRKAENIKANVLPRPLRAVCMKAKALITNNAEEMEAKICLHPSAGEFLTIHATVLQSDKQQYAVSCQQTTPQEILIKTSGYYGLSDREKQLIFHLLHGDSTKEIAAALFISPHTVQDHLKSIFVKTGTTTRGELIWVLLNKYNFST